MKNLKLVISLLFFVSGAFAQQNYFVYLQTEDRQPFYVKLEKQIFNSTSTGYLIIPQLNDGNYNLDLGFPRSSIPEHQVKLRIDKKDLGYIIKSMGDNGWGLSNIQSAEVIMAVNNVVQPLTPQKELLNDPYSVMLAKVVNNQSVREREDIEPLIAEVKVPEDKEVKAPDVEVKNGEGTNGETKTDQPEAKAVELSVVKRTYRKKTKDGYEMTYVDLYGGNRDTIKIFVPNEKIEVKKPPEAVKTEIKKEDAPIIIPETKLIAEKPVENKVISTSMINSDCKSFAVEDDVAKLKKKISAETEVDEMIRLAKKAFKSKCFSVDQIKELSTIFARDEGRYQLFDAAYPFVSDSDKFPSLQALLMEEYYINRFKAMVHK